MALTRGGYLLGLELYAMSSSVTIIRATLPTATAIALVWALASGAPMPGELVAARTPDPTPEPDLEPPTPAPEPAKAEPPPSPTTTAPPAAETPAQAASRKGKGKGKPAEPPPPTTPSLPLAEPLLPNPKPPAAAVVVAGDEFPDADDAGIPG